jgi:micrococcal nuclease
MFEYKAKLIRVIDGDTVDAKIDLGFDVWVRKRIRLHGIDAPESRTKDLEEKALGIKSKERLTELLAKNNNEFILESHGIGKYGRCLGVLLTGTIGEININDTLLYEGHAIKYK